MPIIDLRLAAPAERLSSREAARVIAELTSRILRKDPRVTAIAVQRIDPADWFIGGRSLAEWQQSSFFLDIRITDETTTKDEKARYIAAVFETFAERLGPLHEESYIHVHDVRAAAYGYGGLTQERRYIEAALK
ncbi:hypothetical protein [Niveibacterium sp. SC-1]|uniref:tautomerase family protein n=1 Tax=Niveibacterium sp. SC-1 TaxID=3135646 RepID=UPI00311F78A3